MPVSIKAIHFDSRRIAKLRKELNYVSSQAFFRTIPLAEYMREIQQFAERAVNVSPQPRKGGREYFEAWYSRRRYAREWKVTRKTVGNRVLLDVHSAMSSFSEASAKWFRLWEYGSKETFWTAQRSFSFKSETQGYGWTFVREGQVVKHAATEGQNVLAKTKEYIETVLLPRISIHVEDIVRNRLERA